MLHDIISPIELWHRRITHLKYISIPTLRKVNIGFLEFGDQHGGVCHGCSLGRNDKRPFQSSDSRDKGTSNLIHSYLCGMISVATLSGYLYFVTFIDDYSQKIWIYFLQTKESNEVLDRFKEFKPLVENQIGRRIKVLH